MNKRRQLNTFLEVQIVVEWYRLRLQAIAIHHPEASGPLMLVVGEAESRFRIPARDKCRSLAA